MVPRKQAVHIVKQPVRQGSVAALVHHGVTGQVGVQRVSRGAMLVKSPRAPSSRQLKLWPQSHLITLITLMMVD